MKAKKTLKKPKKIFKVDKKVQAYGGEGCGGSACGFKW